MYCNTSLFFGSPENWVARAIHIYTCFENLNIFMKTQIFEKINFFIRDLKKSKLPSKILEDVDKNWWPGTDYLQKKQIWEDEQEMAFKNTETVLAKKKKGNFLHRLF